FTDPTISDISTLSLHDALPICPGQIVGYPILNLGEIHRDVVWYVRILEEAMMRATAEFGITAGREPGKTGVWVEVGEDTCFSGRSEEHTSELQSRGHLVCRLLL